MRDNEPIIDMARALGRAIQLDERYKAYDKARQENDDDEQLQKAIGEFNIARMNLNMEVAKEDADNDKISEYNRVLQDAYEAITDCEGMQKYTQAKEDLDKLMSYVQAILSAAISGQDPDAVEEPSGCSGDCGSCGGCH